MADPGTCQARTLYSVCCQALQRLNLARMVLASHCPSYTNALPDTAHIESPTSGRCLAHMFQEDKAVVVHFELDKSCPMCCTRTQTIGQQLYHQSEHTEEAW